MEDDSFRTGARYQNHRRLNEQPDCNSPARFPRSRKFDCKARTHAAAWAREFVPDFAMTASSTSAKTILRQELRTRLNTIPAGERPALARQMCERMAGQDLWRRASSILLFSPLPDEPDITLLLEAGWRADKAVSLPQFDPAGGGYLASAVRSLAELKPGRFGVLEPTTGCPVMPLNQLDLVLVPGVAFDLLGGRLGRGKGFYDRLLANIGGHKCGVAFEIQIVPCVPVEPHDVRVDSILTPTRWHPCATVGLK